MARRVREFVCDPDVLATVPVHGLSGDEIVESAHVVSAYGELREMVGQAIERLPSPYREVIEAIYYERASYDVIAGRMGVGHRSTIMRWNRKAIELLSCELEEERCRCLLVRLSQVP